MAKGSADEFGRPAPEPRPEHGRDGHSRALAFAVGLTSVLAVGGVIAVVLLVVRPGSSPTTTEAGAGATTSTTRPASTTTKPKPGPPATQPVETTTPAEPANCASYVWRADQLAASIGYEGLMELSDQIADLLSQARADGCSLATVSQIQHDLDTVQGMQRTS